MPELPEVETIRADLEPLLLGRTVQETWGVESPKYSRLPEAVGRSIRGLRRRGKYLLADLGDRELILHLGMTGQVTVSVKPPSDFSHVRVSLRLDDKTSLYFNDPRRFGRVAIVEPGYYADHPTLAAIGPEPLGSDFDLEAFTGAVGRAATIKPLLLNQRLVAGVGNIYADEALHRAGIHPSQGLLRPAEARRLHAAVREVLENGVRNRGTTFKDYRDGMGRYGTNQDFLRVYDREGEACLTCETPILKTVLGGRGTYYCPQCQPLKRRKK